MHREPALRNELDRWILSELGCTTSTVIQRMDAYDNYAACTAINEFVDALSNWYVRRSRDRFWASGSLADTPDKSDAYWTLYECLVETCKLVAPFVPFLAEAMWRNLAANGDCPDFRPAKMGLSPFPAPESVHLCDYPTPNEALIDQQLSEQMALVREIVSLGRSARMGAKLKVRQPLARVEVVLAEAVHRNQPWLENHAALVREELNVKEVEFIQRAEQYVDYTVLPDLRRLGPRLGKRLPKLRNLLSDAHATLLKRLMADLESTGRTTLDLDDGAVELEFDDLQIRMQAKPGWAAAQGQSCVVILSTELTDALLAEGLARELVHAVQGRRKDLACEYTDRIAVGVVTDSAAVTSAAQSFTDYIRGETLAVELLFDRLPAAEPIEVKLGDDSVVLYVKVAGRQA